MRATKLFATLLSVVVILSACDKKKSPTQPEPPKPPTILTIIAGQGVQITATKGEHPHGSNVPYQVQALPGYGTPDVVIDSTVTAATGTIRMDRNHVLFASAPVASAAIPQSDPVLSSARQVLTAADPAVAWGEHLQRVATLVANVPADSAQRHLARVSLLAFDWARDGDAIMRVSAALHGKTFAFGETGGSAAYASGARFQTSAAGSNAVRTAYVYTNGVNNSLAAAQAGMAALAEAAKASGRGTLVRIAGSTPTQSSPRVVYLVNYNHTAMLPLGENYCAWKALIAVAERGAAYAWKLFWMTPGQKEQELGCTTRTDLWESVTQMARHLLNVPTAVPADATRLAERAMAWRGAGYNVVLTAHSQGNLMTLDALQAIRPVRTGQPTCVTFLSLASPLFPATIPNAMRSGGIVIKHGRAEDVIMKVPGAKAPTISTEYARTLEADIPSLWFLGLGGWSASYTMEVITGIRLHALDQSYLRPGESRDWIMARLGSDYDYLAEHCGGYLEGRVIDGETRQPITGARIRIAGAASPVATTDAAGTYVTSMLQARRHTLVVEADGYETVDLHAIEPVQLDTLTVGVVPLVKTSPHPGGIAGRIRNARSLAVIAGAQVTLRRGINATAGEVAGSATTGADGRYSISGVRAGTYTVTVSAPRFVTETRTGIVIGERVVAGQDLDLSPDDLDLRIKLTWGSTPADLDLHLTGPLASGGRFRVYWAGQGSLTGAPHAALDVDDVSSYGPETITVVQEVNGVYRYSVHDFTNRSSTTSTALARSDALVVVYRRGQLIASFSVPNQPGITWTVFEMENGVIRPVNTVGYAYPAVRTAGEEDPAPTSDPKTTAP